MSKEALGWQTVSIEVDGTKYSGSYKVTDGLVTVNYSKSAKNHGSKSTRIRGSEYSTAQMLLLEFIDLKTGDAERIKF